MTHIPPAPMPTPYQPQPWMAEANCIGADSEAFFPIDVGGNPSWAEPAKRICARCPVRRECLDFALADPRLQGVWGGKDETERREMRKR